MIFLRLGCKSSASASTTALEIFFAAAIVVDVLVVTYPSFRYHYNGL